MGHAKAFRGSCVSGERRARRSNSPRTCRPSRRSRPGRAGRFASRSSATSRGSRTPTVRSFRHGSCIKNCDGVVTKSQSSAPMTRMRTPEELAPGTVELPSVPLKTYPGVHLPMPLAPWIFDPDRWDFDICFAQTTSLLARVRHLAAEDEGRPAPLRQHDASRGGLRRAPAREALEERDAPGRRAPHADAPVRAALLEHLQPERRARRAQRGPARVLAGARRDRADPRHPARRAARGVRPPARRRSVHAPDRPRGSLPQRGPRLLCAGRHTREKAQDRVIRIFARHVLPQEPDATLTLVGDGPDTRVLPARRARARSRASRLLHGRGARGRRCRTSTGTPTSSCTRR